jgi:hypothetical protein
MWCGVSGQRPACGPAIPLNLFATLAIKLGMSKIGLIVIGIYILGAVITFGLAMVSGFAIMIKLCGAPTSSTLSCFVPGYQVFCIFKYWKKFRALFIFQCSMCMTWPVRGLGHLFSLLSTMFFS